MSSARTTRTYLTDVGQAQRVRSSERTADRPSHVVRFTPASASLATRSVADQAAALTRATGGRLTRAGHALLQLQGQYGNCYVQQVVSNARQAASPAGAPTVPAKLVLPLPSDRYEQEADRVAEEAGRRSKNETGLPDGVKAGVERLSGHSLDDVRVRYNSPSPLRFGAFAYTNGSNIDVGPGQEEHVAHEAWHVVQQLQGRVRPTVRAGDISLNMDDQLEREADEMGAKASLIGRARETMDNHEGGREIPALDAHLGEPTGQVTQLKTNLRFSGEVNGGSRITATEHTRAAVHKTAADWVFDNGEWRAVPGGTVINHSKSYESAAQHILETYIHKTKLKQAAKNIMIIYEELQGHGKGVGTPTSTHASRLQAIRNYPENDVNVDDVMDSFNYYIYKICDYPANLFVWPDKTDTEPDMPKGEYDDGDVMDWDAQDPPKSKKKRLQDEKTRLVAASKELGKAVK
jgi:hypothetical protein